MSDPRSNDSRQDHHDAETEEDTASGGPADPPTTTDEDGTPVENPSGG